MGLRDSVLFIDSGTGPDMRAVTLFDLGARRVLVSWMVYAGDVMRGPTARTVTIWRASEMSQPAKGCPPPPYSMGTGIDSLFVVDLRTGKLTFAGKTRCAVRQ